MCLSLVLVACQQEENEIGQEDREELIHVKNSDPVERKEYSNQEIAKHLANLASEVPNVNGANSVVAGPYAVVGIDVDKELDRSRVGTIKYAVTEALHEDPYGKTAIVVADADGAERIRDIANKIQQGQPIQGFVYELSEIVGRYMPELPLDENPPTDEDQNKGSVSEQEEEQLDEIQDEQSKHKLNQ